MFQSIYGCSTCCIKVLRLGFRWCFIFFVFDSCGSVAVSTVEARCFMFKSDMFNCDATMHLHFNSLKHFLHTCEIFYTIGETAPDILKKIGLSICNCVRLFCLVGWVLQTLFIFYFFYWSVGYIDRTISTFCWNATQ